MDFPKETASESEKERTTRVDGVGRERTRVRFDERRATIFFGGSARFRLVAVNVSRAVAVSKTTTNDTRAVHIRRFIWTR